MIKSIITVDELEVGNMFYIEALPSFELNEDQLGDDWSETGDDMVLIVDSIEELDDYIGVYDTGGVYWGAGKELRVSYTKDMSYINFYRKE